MSSFLPICISLDKSNFKIKSNIKIKSDLNPNAPSFIPENKEALDNENKMFDALENEFVKNNDWIFYM